MLWLRFTRFRLHPGDWWVLRGYKDTFHFLITFIAYWVLGLPWVYSGPD